jgi:hypothetical protein
VQLVTQVINSPGLKGAFVPHKKPKLTDSTWFSGDFQRAYELYLNDTIGFHQDFIRLRNQIDYSLFDKCHSADIEVGKNEYLVATWHLDFHTGKRVTRQSRRDSVVSMLKDLSDTLEKMNKTFVFIFAPSRASFYKELTPNWYDLTQANESDYQNYSRALVGSKVRTIDFNKWFLSQKGKSKYPLYTKCGIHWSSYGAAIASDSIFRFIEKAKNVDLPDISVSKIDVTTKARGADADLATTLNLIWKIKNDTMAYPEFRFNKKDKAKLKLLTIGDSYYYGVLENYSPKELFTENSFWYYNKTIISDGPNNGKTTHDIDLAAEINKHDVILIISTEATLDEVGWGFIDRAWQLLFLGKQDRLTYYIQKIKNDPAWFAQVKQKALQYNKDINLQLEQDAYWAVEQEKQRK